MPTYGVFGPYIFVFWSADRNERPHVHVKRDDSVAKFWVDVVELADNHGYNPHELRRIARLVEFEQTGILAFWYDYFGD